MCASRHRFRAGREVSDPSRCPSMHHPHEARRRPPMSRRTAVILATTLVVAIAAVAAVGAGASNGAATVKTRSTSLGTILVDAKGHTLYLFEKDKHGKSSCSGACASNWPPLIAHG